jgi:hypothetical protein
MDRKVGSRFTKLRLILCPGRLDSISEYGRDIGAQASKLKTVIVNMTDDLGDEEPVILNKQTEFEKLSRIGRYCQCFGSGFIESGFIESGSGSSILG